MGLRDGGGAENEEEPPAAASSGNVVTECFFSSLDAYWEIIHDAGRQTLHDDDVRADERAAAYDFGW